MTEPVAFDFKCNPQVAWLTINRACNFRCSWCYVASTTYEPRDMMTLEFANSLTHAAVDAGATKINLIGGEPTLWPHLLDYNRRWRSDGIQTGLITNAARFGNDTFWERYQHDPCDQIALSVKSVNPAQFTQVTGSRNFTQTMRGIKRAIDFYNVGVSTVYNTLVGLDGLKEIALTCKELGASSFMVTLCSPTIGSNGKATLGAAPDVHDLAADLIEIQPVLDELYDGRIEFEMYVPLCLFPPDFIELLFRRNQIATTCHVYDRSGLNFDTHGNVMPCNELFDTHLARYGSEYTNGAELLNHLNMPELRDGYRQLLRRPSSECEGCRWENDCRGGCLLNWMVLEPSICTKVPVLANQRGGD